MNYRKALWVTLFVHILLFSFFLIRKPPAPKSEKILVKNYVLKKKESPRPSLVVAKPKVKPKVSKAKVTKKEKRIKKAPKKASQSNSILLKVQKSLKEIQTNKNIKAPQPSLQIPKTVKRHKVKANVTPSKEKPKNLNEVIKYLEEQLELPEKGTVKIYIRVSAGKIIELSILESESLQNEHYLKNRLPHLTLPCFNKKDEMQELTIRFKNL